MLRDSLDGKTGGSKKSEKTNMSKESTLASVATIGDPMVGVARAMVN